MQRQMKLEWRLDYHPGIEINLGFGQLYNHLLQKMLVSQLLTAQYVNTR